MIFGQNYDWKDCKVLIVHTKPENGNSHLRLEKLAESSKAADGKMSAEEVAEVLKSVSTGQYGYDELTVWSAVFEPANQKISYFFKKKYENKVVLELKQN